MCVCVCVCVCVCASVCVFVCEKKLNKTISIPKWSLGQCKLLLDKCDIRHVEIHINEHVTYWVDLFH